MRAVFLKTELQFSENAATVLEWFLYEITFCNWESLEPDKQILRIILEDKTDNTSGYV